MKDPQNEITTGYTHSCANDWHLADIRKNPFDRLLVAQAIVEGIHLLTFDTLIAQYAAPVICVKKMFHVEHFDGIHKAKTFEPAYFE